MIERILQINNGLDGGFFLSGPRQAGKTTALLMQFPNAIYFDLLDTDIKNRYMRRPAILYELLQDKPDQTQVIIDEIAEVPEQLKEVTGLLSDAIMSLFSVVRAQENWNEKAETLWDEELFYWRTYTGWEVDAVIGDARVAIEIKSVEEMMNRHLKGLKAFGGKYPKSRRIIVSLDMFNRRMGETECVYVHDSLKRSEGVWFHWIKQL